MDALPIELADPSRLMTCMYLNLFQGKDRSDLFDVGITNYFFFREDEEKVGKADRVSFFDYFKVHHQQSLGKLVNGV